MRLRFIYQEYVEGSFNPRICKRCDKANALAVRAIMVSIHASVKDATPISIHQSGRGSFNPRICKRCDLPSSSTGVEDVVSIHASVKDATWRSCDFGCG
ncbi:Uncharacterised protein [Parabacteroides merdae]|nr:Uncharacterised protein [Parabacteroides merdae]